MRLASDPALRHAVRAELEQLTAGEPPTVEHLAELRLAAGVVHEVLRLHPPAVVSVRYVVDPFTLHGHEIPAGSAQLSGAGRRRSTAAGR